MFPSPETAIENACRLIDDGHDVFGIGTGALADSIQPEQIARIYAMWRRAKSPFGDRVRIPTKPATHSNRKPATDSDLKPAGVPI